MYFKYILYSALVCSDVFEIRRGCEKVHAIRFERVWDVNYEFDVIYEFECWRKNLNEKNNKHKGGTTNVVFCS